MFKTEAASFTLHASHPETQPETPAGQFLEGVVSSAADVRESAVFSETHEPAPFLSPGWEPSAPAPAVASPGGSDDGSGFLQEQSEVVLREAEQEAQRLKEEAYAAGCAAGEQRGFEAGQERVEALLCSLGQALGDVGRLRAKICEQSEQQLLELALAIAEKVLHHEVRINRTVVLHLVRAGIKKATRCQELRIKVHPADMLFTVSCKAQLLSSIDGIETITFEENDMVPPGSCVLETPTEIVDLRWAEQLEEVASGLFKAYDRGREEGNG